MIQKKYNLSAKQRKEIFMKYCRPFEPIFHSADIEDIVGYKEESSLIKDYSDNEEKASFKSLLKRIIKQ